MGRTVAELRASLNADELAQWIAVDRKFPIGDERFDYMLAQICLRVFQAAGIKKGRPRKPRPDDWQLADFLLFKEPEKQKTDVQILKESLGHMVIKKGAK